MTITGVFSAREWQELFGERYNIETVLLILTVLLAGFRGVFSKIGNVYMREKQDLLSFHFASFLAGGIIIVGKCIAAGGLALSFYTGLLAVLYAFFTLMSQMLFAKATDHGDVALSSLVYCCGFILPTLFGAIAYREQLTFGRTAGILLVVLAFFISTVSKTKAVSGKWVLYSLTAMLSSGMVGILQKIFRASAHGEEMNGLLAVAFTLIIAVLFLLIPKTGKKSHAPGFYKTAAIVGICFGGCNIINTYLAGRMPSVIVYPAINGGGIISSGVIAYLVLRERLSFRKWCGIFVGLVGIIWIAL